MLSMRRRLAALAVVLSLGGPAHAEQCGGRDLFAGAEGQALAARVAPFSERQNADATFWRVTAPDASVKPSYLLGTIHFTDDRITTLPPKVAAALDDADVLAVEAVEAADPQPDKAVVQLMLQRAAYFDGRSLKTVLSEADYAAVLQALATRGMPGWYMTIWKPWAVLVSALAYPPCEMQRQRDGLRILDTILVKRARGADTPVVSLEDFEQQLDTIDAVPDAVQVAMLRATLAWEPKVDDLHETMVQLYLAGRIGTVFGLSKALLAETAPGADFTPFWRGLLDTRNARMIARATELAQDGNAFIAAGAGHLIGDSGLVAGLRRAGFTVEAVR